MFDVVNEEVVSGLIPCSLDQRPERTDALLLYRTLFYNKSRIEDS